MTLWLAKLWLRIWRWKAAPLEAPLPDRAVVIAAPHTSNWDFPLMLALGRIHGLRVQWLGKQELFRGPMGPIMRRLGGVAIDRSVPGGLVSALASEFQRQDRLTLVIPAEGTRSKVEVWKSGFYRISEAADVPILLSYLDKATRSGGFGPALHPSGDITADMNIIRDFYRSKTGLKPGHFGRIALAEELMDDELPDEANLAIPVNAGEPSPT